MSDLLCFESSLSLNEIENNFNEFDFFSNLVAGLNEALAYEKGKASVETFAKKVLYPQLM